MDTSGITNEVVWRRSLYKCIREGQNDTNITEKEAGGIMNVAYCCR